MKISRSIILHTLLCSITAIVIVIAYSKAFQNIQNEQHRFDTDLVILRDYQHLQQSSQQWLTLSDLIMASGETYLINGTLEQSKVLLKLVGEIEKYLIVINAQSITELLNVLIKNNDIRIKKTENLAFDEEQEAYYKLLNELDNDAQIFIKTLTELKKKLESSVEQRNLILLAQRSQLQTNAWFAGLFYLLLVFLSWRWQSNLLVKPIQNLTLAARKALIEDAPIELEEAGSTEVRELTHYTYRFVSTLETKIQERTTELQQRKNELEIENISRKKAESKALKAQEQAEAASLAKSEFLATMSHEIRTPMNGVLGMTELMMASKLDARQAHLASTAHRSAEGLLSIINDILDFSKIETGKFELDEMDFELVSFLEDIVDTVADSAHRKHIELVSDLAYENACTVRGDESRLRQILINLLGNAIKFTERGDVRLTQRIANDESNSVVGISFEISDTGVGIPEDKQSLIFDAFTQSDNSISRKYGGTGLGLAITHKLVAMMGGVLEVDSEEGVGSCFRFTIRLTKINAKVKPQLDTKQLHGLRVLCVDDHSTNREILQHQLVGWGMHCSGVKSASEALDRLQTAATEGNPYKLALLDWHMPEMTGNVLARSILSDPLIPDLPTILLSSAYLPAADSTAASGINASLTKPIRGSQLLDCIKSVLDTSAKPAEVLEQIDEIDELEPIFDASILVAEDNPVNQEVAEGILELFGCSVTLANNGQQAIDLMNDSTFDLILMDCHMPEVDGFEATHKIREMEQSTGQSRIPIIALTADVRKGLPERCLEAGMDSYLSKPFNLKKLSTELSKWLDTVSAGDLVESSIQTSHIDELKALSVASGKDLLGSVIKAFCEHVPELIISVRAAFEQKDWQSLADAVHSLKSSSANVGATHLSKLCAEAELSAREEDGFIQASHIEDIEHYLNKALSELNNLSDVKQVEDSNLQMIHQAEQPRLLLIDDDPTFRLKVGEGLRVAGFTVTDCGSGSGGLYEAEKQVPDLILLDAVMDDMDGFETCQRLMENPILSQIPVVMITGLDDVSSVHRAFEVGASGFTPKPVNLPILIEQVRFILRATNTEEHLRENQAMLSSAQRMARLGYWRWSIETDVFEPSEHLESICGMPSHFFDYGMEGFISKLHTEDQHAVKNAIEEAVQNRESSTIEYSFIVDHDQEVKILQKIEIRDDKQGHGIVFGTMQDVTTLRATEDRIRKLAFYDPLTSLASRSNLLQRLDENIKSAHRHKEKFALMFMDLDGFKDVNDSLGHDVGDQLLVTIAERLRLTMRETDFIARLGGDEFCVILNEVGDSCNIAETAQRCLTEIEQPVDLGEQTVRPRMSIGIAHYPDDSDTTHSLLKAADSAMYAAKKQGKHCYAFYNEEMTHQAEKRLSAVYELREAFSRKEFVLHYQPMIDLKTGTVVTMEALVRWQHPERGLIYPDNFLPELESIGLIEKLGDYVLKEACEQALCWDEQGLPPISISVNISPDHFRNPDLIDTVQNLLRQTGLSPSRLELEVTESVAQYHGDTITTIEQLKNIGIKIAIDDFGTGYSSLASLKHLQIDKLKIDRAFIQEMHINPKDSILLGTIFGLAHALNFSVVAEGAEEIEQVQILHSLGCDLVQGYYFSKPVPAEMAGDLISQTFLPNTGITGSPVKMINDALQAS